jgi:hypothetical protein
LLDMARQEGMPPKSHLLARKNCKSSWSPIAI